MKRAEDFSDFLEDKGAHALVLDLGICLDEDEQVSEAVDIVTAGDGEDALVDEGVDMCLRNPSCSFASERSSPSVTPFPFSHVPQTIYSKRLLSSEGNLEYHV